MNIISAAAISLGAILIALICAGLFFVLPFVGEVIGDRYDHKDAGFYIGMLLNFWIGLTIYLAMT